MPHTPQVRSSSCVTGGVKRGGKYGGFLEHTLPVPPKNYSSLQNWNLRLNMLMKKLVIAGFPTLNLVATLCSFFYVTKMGPSAHDEVTDMHSPGNTIFQLQTSPRKKTDSFPNGLMGLHGRLMIFFA